LALFRPTTPQNPFYMRDFYTVRINFKGGIASPAELKTILEIANEFQVYKVRFGLRQQMIFSLSRNYVQAFTQIAKNKSFTFEIDSNSKPNIHRGLCPTGLSTLQKF